MKTVKALIVHPDGTHEVTQVEDDLRALQGAIGGGWIEGVSSTVSGDWHAYCDEEGKLKGLPLNPVATVLAHKLGWPVGDMLAGDVIFLGSRPTGEEADVPQRVLDILPNLKENH